LDKNVAFAGLCPSQMPKEQVNVGVNHPTLGIKHVTLEVQHPALEVKLETLEI